MNTLKVMILSILVMSFCFITDSNAQERKGKKSSGDRQTESVITKKADGSIIVNTSKLKIDIKGFNGPTPIEMTVKKGKIISVKALPNQETPAYFRKLLDSGFMNSWNGMSLKEAETLDVDAVSGATFSSKSIKENVKAAVKIVKNK